VCVVGGVLLGFFFFFVFGFLVFLRFFFFFLGFVPRGFFRVFDGPPSFLRFYSGDEVAFPVFLAHR